jgi:hypothetical protein
MVHGPVMAVNVSAPVVGLTVQTGAVLEEYVTASPAFDVAVTDPGASRLMSEGCGNVIVCMPTALDGADGTLGPEALFAVIVKV